MINKEMTVDEAIEWVLDVTTPPRPDPSAWNEEGWIEHWRDQRRQVIKVLQVAARSRTHQCSGCGHRWDDLPANELCGDCWRLAQPVLHNDVKALAVEAAQLRARINQLEAEIIEHNTLREKLGDILSRTAIALHGGPLDMGLWSWHNLPELVERLRKRDDPANDSSTNQPALVETQRTIAQDYDSATLAGGPVKDGAFDKMTDLVEVNSIPDGLYLKWSRKGVGFGTLTLKAKDGRLVADTECMSDEFCLEVLAQALRERVPEWSTEK